MIIDEESELSKDIINGKPGDKRNIRAGIQALEDAIVEIDAGDIPGLTVTHHFCDGIYARELFIPKGVCLTGKIHRTEHLNIVSKGKMQVVTEFGPKTISAPHTMVSEPGTKRAGYALEDTIWTTIHPTHETDLEVIEKLFIANSYEDFLLEEDKKCLG